MEDPQGMIKCPDCNGTGNKILFDWVHLEEYPDECQLCLGTGEISEMDWGYFKEDKKESIKEDQKDLDL